MNEKAKAIGGLAALILVASTIPSWRATADYFAGIRSPITEKQIFERIERRLELNEQDEEHQRKIREIQRTAYPTGELSISEEAMEYIKNLEGFEPEPYTDGTQISIGYGSRVRPGENITTITKDEAELRFVRDIEWVEDALKRNIEVPVTQTMYDALGSFVYNTGEPQFKRSTLLKKLNMKDYEGVRDEFEKWVYSSGEVKEGLVIRRAEERAMFEAIPAIDENGAVLYNPRMDFSQVINNKN
jgi:lysozyme